MSPYKQKIRVIAFVLPQFHPIPENDEWWGKGFTEWTNVTKASPLYEGHYQPRLPTDLGFYDLRLPEARKAQAELAQEHGINGFCYYHYWFNGKRLLHQPIDDMLKLKEPKMPFMLCWANENWTRKWDGRNKEVLIEQEYSAKDDANHIRWLCENVFNDERYIKVNGCPVFSVYDHRPFPNLKETAEMWRNIAKKEFGYEDLYLCLVESFNLTINPKDYSFNALIEFSPHKVHKHYIKRNWREKLLRKKKFDLRNYRLAVEESQNRPRERFKLFRCVTPSWDNTARMGTKAIICVGSDPLIFKNWLSSILKNFQPYSKDENFVFINAMNEWAEGNHLEPCIKYGKSYLESTKQAIDEYYKGQ